MNNRIILLTTVMSAAFVISPDIAQGSRKAAMQKDILKQQGVEVQTGEQADYILKQNKVEEAKTAISGGVTPEQYVTDSKAGVAIGNIIMGSVTQRIYGRVANLHERTAVGHLTTTLGIVAGAITQGQLKATVYLQTDPASRGGGLPIAAPSETQVAATVELMTGAHALTAILQPTKANVDAAERLLAIPNLAGVYTDNHLDATVYLQTDPASRGGGLPIAAPSETQVAATVELMTGAHALTAILQPTKANVDAAEGLLAIPALAGAYTDNHLAAAQILLTPTHGAVALAGALTADQVNAVRTAIAINAAVGEEVAWAIQSTWNGGPGTIPAGIAELKPIAQNKHGKRVIKMLWGKPSQLSVHGINGIPFGASLGRFFRQGWTGNQQRVKIVALLPERNGDGDLVVFSGLADDAVPTAVVMNNPGQHP